MINMKMVDIIFDIATLLVLLSLLVRVRILEKRIK